MWITNGPVADTMVIYAKAAAGRGVSLTSIVEKGFKGFAPAQKLDKLAGLRTPTNWYFTDCEVPEENVLGRLVMASTS